MDQQLDPEMSFQQFLNWLPGKTVAIVYSYSNTPNKNEIWYDRWKSDVISYFGLSVEYLMAEVRYIDVDTFLNLMGEKNSFIGDIIINLHSGLNKVGAWPIVSSLACWKGLPVVPCGSDVHIASERKDIGNALTRETEIKVPPDWNNLDEEGKTYIVKPTTLGMSRNVFATQDHARIAGVLAAGNFMAQEFISGFDATVAILMAPTGRFEVLGGALYIPFTKSPNWFLTEEDKLDSHEALPYERCLIDIDSDLAGELSLLAQRIGFSSVYRVDFRVEPEPNGQPPSILTLSNSWFLEANPMPTTSRSSSLHEIMRAAIKDQDTREALNCGLFSDLKEDELAQVTLVAAQLYAACAFA